MTSAEIRRSFLDFFAARGHRIYPSAPLVPHGDATLLFINAGMVPFKEIFLGREAAASPRAVSSQKCLRVSGKHNDLENVGPSPRHHTFFEMLGNFSFGDYFKAEAIAFGWELVTGVWGLAPGRLFASVYEEDDEAWELWQRIAGLPAARVVRCGKEDNFWAMGETGPCGPCSEIYVDLDPDRPEVGWQEGTESGRYLEIWNLVFMQFDRDASGAMRPLPKPSIDTGAGLERVASVLGGHRSNYDTDLFQPLIRAAAALAGRRYGAGEEEEDVALRVVADHLRAAAFLLADGVVPGNEGRGYVLRRLVRRAARHGLRLGFEEPFLHRLLPVVGEILGAAYPELGATEQGAAATLRAEEGKFLATLATGSRQVQEAIERARAAGSSRLAGPEVFRLYDTYGLPVELLREIAEEERFRLDEEGFAAALAAQRERSRQHLSETQRRLGEIRAAVAARVHEMEPVLFTGHLDRAGGSDGLRLAGERPQVLVSLAGGSPRAVGALAAGETGVAIFARTPFYAEAGGQVADLGTISWPGGRARVTDVQKLSGHDYYHFLEVEEGTLSTETEVELAVDPAHRLPTQRNHTATHLLQAALRQVLGAGVRQAGSLVHPDHLRFDFTHPQALSAAERREVEDLVNGWVLAARPTAIVPDRPRDEAIAAGAMALFGEKYGERVRTVEVPGVSLELCGGCHVANTGEIGPFVIVAERAVASGVRRIEALTGEGAIRHAREQAATLARLEELLGVPAARAEEELAGLRQRLREAEREVGRLRVQLVSGGGAGSEEVEVAGVRVLAREVPPAPAPELRTMADALRGRLGSGVVVLGTRAEGKVTLLAAVTPDLAGRVHAGRLVQRLAPLVGGSGGGRPDFAQAGGKLTEELPRALAEAPAAVAAQVAGGS
ncbi:MAG TPA: alanine--tRNA ligase [Thermoanaerobaculia bacterium]|nr:MAG: Alanine--tRNA ligase [Acidobacteria bacterium ADurb.Bin051]HNU83041.1 alanine--tRNA ligase [Thermoanaerobaculia bacterium]